MLRAFADRAVNVLAFGTPGVGKSHGMSALGHALVSGLALGWLASTRPVSALAAGAACALLAWKGRRLVLWGLAALDLLSGSTALRDKVMDNAARFRAGMTAAGFTIKPGIHPIVPVMLGDAVLAQKVAAALLEEGIYAIGFFFPVVPKGEARIRVQLSAVHEDADIDRAVAAFTRVGKGLGVV